MRNKMVVLQKWEEEQTAKKEAQKAAEVKYAFEELDTDSDGYLTVREVQQRIELDDDNNGEVRGYHLIQ